MLKIIRGFQGGSAHLDDRKIDKYLSRNKDVFRDIPSSSMDELASALVTIHTDSPAYFVLLTNNEHLLRLIYSEIKKKKIDIKEVFNEC